MGKKKRLDICGVFSHFKPFGGYGVFRGVREGFLVSMQGRIVIARLGLEKV